MAELRFQINDKAIERLPPPENGRYIVRDTELKGFFLVVGTRKKTFTIQGDLREEGKRAATIRVAIGDTSEMSTRAARAVAKEYLSQISPGAASQRRVSDCQGNDSCRARDARGSQDRRHYASSGLGALQDLHGSQEPKRTHHRELSRSH